LEALMSQYRRSSLSRVAALAAIFFAILWPAAAVSSEDSRPDSDAAKREIMVVLKAHEEHWNRHDMDTWADKVLHEDSDWVNWRGGYWRGKVAIREGHRAIHAAHYKNSRLSPQRIEDLTFITPDIALAHVCSELSGDERAPGQTFSYRKTILFTKQHGAWRIRALHNTRMLDADRPLNR
jgi:uncharacterized protein (TIGR02246 family)